MKKLICLILIFGALLSLCACGELVTPVGPGDRTDPEDTAPPAPDDLKNDPNAFTVSLRFNGEQYFPREQDTVISQWTDGYSFHTAEVGEDGYARIAGLDGDYQVTLKGLQDGFLYNPNAYVATNNDRHIIIDLYKPIRTTGYGTGPYDCIKIKKAGLYRVEIKSADHKVFFQYSPEKEGTYSVESWVSTSQGIYNPKIDVYTGSIAYKLFAYTLDNGGVCEGYTQNFKHIVEVAQEQVDSGGGGAAFTFAIHSESKDGVYPVYIDFAIQLNGSFELEHYDKTLVIPEEDLAQTPNYDGYTFKWAETDTRGVEGRFVFDGSMFKLWSKDEGGDGYYHIYDKETNTYGAILYAKLSSPHRFTEAPFTSIEDAGNSSLTVNGTHNYKLLIEGLEDLLVDPLDSMPNASGGSYFCLHDCPCRVGDAQNAPGIGVCGESCTRCAEGCRHLPDEIVALIDTDLEDGKDPSPDVEKVEIRDTHGKPIAVPKYLCGYASYVNADGVYAVTEELRAFLQGFSISQRYFADGQGWVESNPNVKVDAKEADQWLFACGYYVKN